MLLIIGRIPTHPIILSIPNPPTTSDLALRTHHVGWAGCEVIPPTLPVQNVMAGVALDQVFISKNRIETNGTRFPIIIELIRLRLVVG